MYCGSQMLECLMAFNAEKLGASPVIWSFLCIDHPHAVKTCSIDVGFGLTVETELHIIHSSSRYHIFWLYFVQSMADCLKTTTLAATGYERVVRL